ncbi:MAG: branched-chain amino acid ABC transporter substrate-binding protein [Actinomycetia bacterium]|nr:branched-chain amino acid ABC transporter substrate-binding protein [Actinomycetes bacterium]
MRCRVARSAVALGSAVLLTFGSVACGGTPTPPRVSSDDLTIEPQVEIGSDGTVVEVADGPEPVSPAGDGNAVCPPLSIAMAGGPRGSDPVLGMDIKNGIQLAVDQHNAANPSCQVQLKTFDSEGDPTKGAELAAQIVDDAFTVGVVGPMSSGQAQAAGPVFDRAGLVAVTPSASATALSGRGWRTFFRGIASNAVQGAATAEYMSSTLGHRKVCVVDDSSDQGLDLASSVRETLGPRSDVACNIAVGQEGADSSVVAQIIGAAPDAVFFAGDAAGAAALVRRLREAGFEGAFVTMAGAMTEEFVDEAGAAARDALVSCPCAPAAPEFVDEYESIFDQLPGPYAAEAYDLGTILLKGIDSGASTRAALLDFVGTYDGQGMARRYQWVADGELANPSIWLNQVR